MLDDLFRRRASVSGSTPEQQQAEFAARIPTGDLGSVDDVARAFVYLSSDQSSYVTGQYIVVDGGWQVGEIVLGRSCSVGCAGLVVLGWLLVGRALLVVLR